MKKLNFDINNNNIKAHEDDNKNIKEDKFNSNSEIPNKNIKQLPLIKRNKIIKKISKNLNKEYFIYKTKKEKIIIKNKDINDIKRKGIKKGNIKIQKVKIEKEKKILN